MKYYVYILSYNEIPFYVGKGSGSRMYSHVQTAKRNKSKHPVLSKIRKILANNENVEYSKIFFTDNAVEAYSKEIETIKSIGRRNLHEGPLLNLTDGGEGVINYVWIDSHRKKI